jgi:integrase
MINTYVSGNSTITVNPAFRRVVEQWKQRNKVEKATVENNFPKQEFTAKPTAKYSLYTTDGRPKPKCGDAIKDKDTIQAIKEALLNSGKFGYRNYLIYTVGINVGRRAGDLLKLKVSDVMSKGNIKCEIVHVEEKTGKIIEFYFNDTIRNAIAEYLNSQPDLKATDYLFKSHKGDGRLTTKAYWRILKDVQNQLQLTDHLSTHSMRKTFGYHKYQEYKGQQIEGGFDVVDMLQDAYGHSSRKQTMTYIGISKENKKKLYCDSTL